MKLRKNFVRAILFCCFFAYVVDASSLDKANVSKTQHEKMSESQALELGTAAYIYGYPLVTTDLTRRVMTNVVTPEDLKAPMGQFANAKTYPNASFVDVTAPNADTLYSAAWLDLSKEPYILHVPNQHGRYYLLPMLSAWTNVFAVVGTRTTGDQANDFVIAGPNWKGRLPEKMRKMRVFKSPTNIVWILGRTYCTGTPEDYQAVHNIQSQYQLKPLSYYKKSYVAPDGVVSSSIDMKTPVRAQVNQMDADAYFGRLAELMKNNPPAAQDAAMVAKLAKLGIVPGKPFDRSQLDPDVIKGLEASVKAGQEKILAHRKQLVKTDLRNGWLLFTKTGSYGTDYLQRAFITVLGLGANLPQDALYAVAETDSKGEALSGASRYVMHFAKNQTPPVKGFWSLTMYNDKFFFVDNPLNRYTLSLRDKLKYNSDGSLDLYLQHESPGKDKESNWLPAPEGKFTLMLRFYWPKKSIINRTWQLPAVKQEATN